MMVEVSSWIYFMNCTSIESIGFKGWCNDDYWLKLNEHQSNIVFGEVTLGSRKGMNNDCFVMLCFLVAQ